MAVWYSGSTAGAGFCQIVRPVSASKAVTMPLIPRVKSRLPAKVGVDLGPGP